MDNINKIDERIRQKLLYETYKDMRCPVCGYYCLGKGGVGCINKPMFCGLDNDTKINKGRT